MKATLILSIAVMISMVAAQDNSLRFINAIEGTTLTFYSNRLSEFQLPYQSVTEFNSIPAGTIQITNVVDQNGTSYTSVPIATSFAGYNTLVAIYNEAESDPSKRFLLVLFNETVPSDTSDTTKAFVRLMDLSSSIKFITLASQAGTVASYVGYLQTTAYVPVAASTTSMRIWNTETGSYNTPSLTFNTVLNASNAYTVVFFTTKAGTQSANVVMDRALTVTNPSTTTGSTTGAQLSLTTPSIRFVNAIEGSTLEIFSNKLSEISLPFMESTNYFPIADGVISISNVLSNGTSLNNGITISTSFGAYHTLVAIMNKAETDPTKQFTLVLFNETTPSNMDTATSDPSKAWVRLINLAQTGKLITMAYTAGSIASYVGFLVNTPFVAVPATTTSVRFYDSTTGNYNSPSLTFNTALTAMNAYTIMFFETSTGVQSAKLVNDRQVQVNGTDSTTGQTNTTGTVTSTSGSAGTTGVIVGATTSVGTGMEVTTSDVATGMDLTTSVVMPPMTTRGVINNQENSAGKVAAFGLISLIAIALL